MQLNSKAVLITKCTSSYTPEHVDDLNEMYEHDKEISYSTFARHVAIAPIAAELGYAYNRGEKGVRLSRDHCVRFYRSLWKGEPCFHMDWSAIDHIYMIPKSGGHHDQA